MYGKLARVFGLTVSLCITGGMSAYAQKTNSEPGVTVVMDA